MPGLWRPLAVSRTAVRPCSTIMAYLAVKHEAQYSWCYSSCVQCKRAVYLFSRYIRMSCTGPDKCGAIVWLGPLMSTAVCMMGALQLKQENRTLCKLENEGLHGMRDWNRRRRMASLMLITGLILLKACVSYMSRLCPHLVVPSTTHLCFSPAC